MSKIHARKASILAATLFLFAAEHARAQTPISGCSVISGVVGPASYKVVSDISSCPSYGIRVVNSSDITIDLNGRNLLGSLTCGPTAVGISVEQSPRTIIHGNMHTPGAPTFGATIQGWDRGISFVDAADSIVSATTSNGGIYVQDNITAGVTASNSPRIVLKQFLAIRNGGVDVQVSNTDAAVLQELVVGRTPTGYAGVHTGILLTNAPNADLISVAIGTSGANTHGIWINTGSNNAEIKGAGNQFNNATGAAIRVSAPGASLQTGTFNQTGMNVCDIDLDGGSISVAGAPAVTRFPSLPYIGC
jgi:hypothetical protein